MIRKELQEVVRHLKRGGLVIYPTETSYGIGADATNPSAVRAVFKLKGRSAQKSLPLIVGTMRQALTVAHFSSRARALARTHWPGPLTMALPIKKSARLVKGVGSRGIVAIRVPAHPMARALARTLGRPLVATSANRAGKPSCYSIRAARKQFGARLAGVFVIDVGALAHRKPSTIVRIMDHTVTVLRQGGVRI